MPKFDGFGQKASNRYWEHCAQYAVSKIFPSNIITYTGSQLVFFQISPDPCLAESSQVCKTKLFIIRSLCTEHQHNDIFSTRAQASQQENNFIDRLAQGWGSLVG